MNILKQIKLTEIFKTSEVHRSNPKSAIDLTPQQIIKYFYQKLFYPSKCPQKLLQNLKRVVSSTNKRTGFQIVIKVIMETNSKIYQE
jgi:hypothetical protein